MCRRLTIAGVAVAAALATAGCKTDTSTHRVNKDVVIVRDEGDGGNPEKGLGKACPGRYIDSWKRIDFSSIAVVCGPER